MAKAVFWRLIFLVLMMLIILQAGYYLSKRSKVYSENQSPRKPPVQKTIKTTNKNVIFEDIHFPKNFFFGTASSDFQTTGGNGNTDWNKYIQDNQGKKLDDGRMFIGPENGTDFLNRYKEDFDLAEQFHDQVHRISLEWARIEPEEGKIDKKAVEKYKEIFIYMRSRGIEPMICLNHFALPLWFVEKGGWESPQAAEYYSRYARVVARQIGLPLKIKWWLTFNEPQVMLLPYIKGHWPPDKPALGLKDSEGSQRVARVASNLIDSHRLSYRIIHKIIGSQAMVSFASAPGSFYPQDPASSLDQIAYNIHNALSTLLFDYAVGKVDRDFIGLNYYGRAKLELHISLPNAVKFWLNENNPMDFQWHGPLERKQGSRPKEFYPQALYDLIMKFKDFNLPIVITENGLSDDSDKFREEFIVIHLKAISDAMRDGVNIIGYQYWALTDTWEWDAQFSQMGLIKIDRESNLERKLRPSALTYGEIIKTHTIKKELLEKYKELLVSQK